MLPTATNSVIGSVPRGDSGVGSATNTVALQVGGALGVAVVGSVMLTRYQGHMKAVLSGRHVPASVAHTILGSLGGALAVAAGVGGTTGALLARAARTAFMSGNGIALGVAAIVSLGGAVLVLAALPSRPRREPDRQAAEADQADRIAARPRDTLTSTRSPPEGGPPGAADTSELHGGVRLDDDAGAAQTPQHPVLHDRRTTV